MTYLVSFFFSECFSLVSLYKSLSIPLTCYHTFVHIGPPSLYRYRNGWACICNYFPLTMFVCLAVVKPCTNTGRRELSGKVGLWRWTGAVCMYCMTVEIYPALNSCLHWDNVFSCKFAAFKIEVKISPKTFSCWRLERYDVESVSQMDGDAQAKLTSRVLRVFSPSRIWHIWSLSFSLNVSLLYHFTNPCLFHLLAITHLYT